ncbi:MAG: response regulator [Chloroflexi bacterium]|nr:response regulator [Chloroflexota bacterium]
MQVLYVEDNVLDSDLVAREISRQPGQFALTTARTLQEARHILQKNRQFDLILVDLHLPDGNGLELLTEIRGAEMPTAVVILTSSGDEDSAVAALKAGANDYIIKRDNYISRLPEVLTNALARFHAEIDRKNRPLRVLYVEHNSADSQLAQIHLQRYAPHILLDVLPSAVAALQQLPLSALEPCPWDILLLDYRLPGLNALDVLKIIHDERFLDLPIILITGQGNEAVATQALRLGAVDYLVKQPGYLFQLPSALENAYHRARLIHEQDALRESEARFRRLAENAQDIIFRLIVKPTAQFDYVSPAAQAITGYSPKEFYADHDFMANRVHPEDRAGFSDLFTDPQAFQPIITMRWQHRDGHTVWIEVHQTPIYDDDHQLIMIEGVARDITNRVLANDKLKLQNATLNAVANAIVITDVNAVVEWINPAFSTLTGYSIEESVGKELGDLIGSNLNELTVVTDMWHTIREGKVWQGEVVNRRKDGSLYTEEQTITPLKDDQNNIIQFIAIKHDISARKQNEKDRLQLLAEVREQAERVRQIIDTVPEGVLLLDEFGRVILANPVGEKDLAILGGIQLGETLTHVGERPLAHFLTPPPRGQWHELTAGSRAFKLIARPIHHDLESSRWVLVINDITQERETQRYQQAQEQLATVGQLAAGIAHDFNNIMGVISLYAQILQEIPNLSAKHQRFLVTIYDQARQAADLISQILDFSRRSVMELTSLDLLPFIKENVKLLERMLPESIAIKLVFDQNRYQVNADPTRIQQVLMNLAINARDAMLTGGTLTFSLTSITVDLGQAPPLPDMGVGEWVSLAISDTGVGMSPQHLSHMFEPFFTTKSPGQGTGLGLAQVYGIVKQHGGSLTVRSKEGEGSTFTLYLPLLTSQESSGHSFTITQNTPSGSEVMLVVEENEAMRTRVHEALAGLGYEGITVNNGVEALAFLGQTDTAVHLILSDLVMPTMGGAELFHALAEQRHSAKILIMTGYPIATQENDLLRTEKIDWIQKPFDIASLAAKVRAVLDKPA